MLDEMIKKLRLASYTPNTSCQVSSGCGGREGNTDEMDEIEQALFYHNEKLAVCFGPIST